MNLIYSKFINYLDFDNINILVNANFDIISDAISNKEHETIYIIIKLK